MGGSGKLRTKGKLKKIPKLSPTKQEEISHTKEIVHTKGKNWGKYYWETEYLFVVLELHTAMLRIYSWH